jgi:hypothetical protein
MIGVFLDLLVTECQLLLSGRDIPEHLAVLDHELLVFGSVTVAIRQGNVGITIAFHPVVTSQQSDVRPPPHSQSYLHFRAAAQFGRADPE